MAADLTIRQLELAVRALKNAYKAKRKAGERFRNSPGHHGDRAHRAANAAIAKAEDSLRELISGLANGTLILTTGDLK